MGSEKSDTGEYRADTDILFQRSIPANTFQESIFCTPLSHDTSMDLIYTKYVIKNVSYIRGSACNCDLEEEFVRVPSC